jgi:MSHA pilin protein MshA
MRENRRLSNSSGFTLIELVIVIVILGVLSAVAAPRFVSLSSDANRAVLESLAGNMRATAQIYNVRAQMESRSGGLDSGFEYQNVSYLLGYPNAVSSGDSDDIPEIIEAMTIDDDYQYFPVNVSTAPNRQRSSLLYLTTASIDSLDADTILATNCYLTYRTYTRFRSEPEIEIETSGC